MTSTVNREEWWINLVFQYLNLRRLEEMARNLPGYIGTHFSPGFRPFLPEDIIRVSWKFADEATANRFWMTAKLSIE